MPGVSWGLMQASIAAWLWVIVKDLFEKKFASKKKKSPCIAKRASRAKNILAHLWRSKSFVPVTKTSDAASVLTKNDIGDLFPFKKFCNPKYFKQDLSANP